MPEIISVEHIRNHIHLVRGHPVLLHTDLARLYGVPKNRLLAQAQHFPGNFCFSLERLEILLFSDEPVDGRNQIYAFTEHGALVMAYMLDTPEAVSMSAQVLRAFVQSRQMVVAHDTLVPTSG